MVTSEPLYLAHAIHRTAVVVQLRQCHFDIIVCASKPYLHDAHSAVVSRKWKSVRLWSDAHALLLSTVIWILSLGIGIACGKKIDGPNEYTYIESYTRGMFGETLKCGSV